MSRLIFAMLLVPLAIPVTVLAQDETAPVETVKSKIPQTLDPPTPQPRLWSICELFEDLASHAGTVVAVRGLLYQGGEIFALGDRCQSKFVTQYQAFPGLPGVTPDLTAEYVWPTAIWLTHSTNRSEGEAPVTFSTDTDSVDRTIEYIVKQRRTEFKNAKSNPDALVTVIGMLRAHSPYIGPLPNGSMHGGGYGHLSAYPAELVILRMSDPVVEVRKPENKQE